MRAWLLKLTAKYYREYTSYLKFFAQILIWLLVITILVLSVAQLLPENPNKASFVNDFILLITAVFVLIYTRETQKIKEQTKEHELRPIIMRTGYIHSWDDLKFKIYDEKFLAGPPIQFRIMKNVAADIRGYVVINKNKYPLYFGNDVSKLETGMHAFNQNWGWMGPETFLFALYLEKDGQKTFGENCFVIHYKNIEGDEYYTYEDDKFSQKSFKV